MLFSYNRKVSRWLINTDVTPRVPSGYKLLHHTTHGNINIDPSQIRLYLSQRQVDSSGVMGRELRDELKGLPLVNATVLDFLLANQSAIPERWYEEMLTVCFWGTILEHPVAGLSIRVMVPVSSAEGQWLSGCGHIERSRWHQDQPAALFSS